MDLRIECPPIYPKGCKVVFIGETPFNETEIKCLQRACSIAGFDFTTVGRSNVCKRRPPGNKFKDCFYKIIEEPIYTKTGKLSKKTKKVERKTEELLQWENALRDELKRENPNLVIACGNEAMEAVIGFAGITDYRGSILADKWGDGHKILAVEHPSFIIRGNPERFWILARDLQKAKREREFPEIRRESYLPIIKPSLETSLFHLDQLKDSRFWTLDVETRAGTLACFAIGYKAKVGMPVGICIPIQTTHGLYWTVEEELKIWRTFRETASHNPNLCNQNIEYDIDYLLRYGVEPSGVYMDTMLAHSILYPELPKDLGFLGSWYLDDVVFWKNDARDWSNRTMDEALWVYNVKDAVYTLRIVEKIDQELQRRGLFEAYHGYSLC